MRAELGESGRLEALAIEAGGAGLEAMLIALGLLMVTGLWTALMSQLQQVVINVPLPL